MEKAEEQENEAEEKEEERGIKPLREGEKDRSKR